MGALVVASIVLMAIMVVVLVVTAVLMVRWLRPRPAMEAAEPVTSLIVEAEGVESTAAVNGVQRWLDQEWDRRYGPGVNDTHESRDS